MRTVNVIVAVLTDRLPFQFECRNEEKKKVQESMQKYEEEKLEVTRALQMKLDDKRAKIARYQAKLKELENNSGAIQKELESKFDGELNEISRKHENAVAQKEEEIEQLDQNLNTLEQFKDTEQQRNENLRKEEQRYQMLLEQLENLKRSGEAEMEAQKKKINDGYEQTFLEYKEKANRDAEKNISEIERNI